MSMLLLQSSTSCILLLLASSFLSTSAQNSFAPVEWTPEVLRIGHCAQPIISDLSDASATVAQLIKSNDSASSVPKSCTEIKLIITVRVLIDWRSMGFVHVYVKERWILFFGTYRRSEVPHSVRQKEDP